LLGLPITTPKTPKRPSWVDVLILQNQLILPLASKCVTAGRFLSR